MEFIDQVEQINSLKERRTAYAAHVVKVFNTIDSLIENCEHFEELNCLPD